MPYRRLSARSIAVLAALSTAALAAAELVNTRLNVNALRAAGQASATSSTIDIGTIDGVFDGDSGTLMRSANINPAFVQVAFTSPRTLRSFRTLFSSDQHRWKVESADSQADMDSQSGTWAEIVPWTNISGNNFSTANLAAARTARLFKLTAERLTGDNFVHIYEWQLIGDVNLTSLAINPASRAMVAGEMFQFAANGTDSGGIAYDATSSAAWSSTNTAAATIGAATGLCAALAAGSTTIHASIGSLSAPGAAVTVSGILPAPGGLTVTPFHTTAWVRWDAISDPSVAGYHVYRRSATGGYPGTPTKRVLARSDFTDSGRTPGLTYFYKVVAINGSGMPVSLESGEIGATMAASADGFSRHKNFETLIAIYRGGFSAPAVTQMAEGLKLGREFYWRTSAGRLNMDFTWIYSDASTPGSDWYSSAVQNDLRARGVQDNQFDLAFLAGNDLAGCFGGYVVFGSTCASLGTVCGVPYPGKNPAVNYTIAWTFTHEIHHALEAMEDRTAGTPEVLFCHFPWAYPNPLGTTWIMDWGPHYDGIAATNRDYGDTWSVYPSPYNQFIECVDADGDGFPDDDPRVAMDEARFGSSPFTADTDGDGLSDLDEYSRYNFAACDPNDPDSDLDGRPDGLDHQPLYPVRRYLPRFAAPPTIDGTIEPAWTPLRDGYYFTQGLDYGLTSYAGWDANALYFAFESNRRLRFMVSIDGSGEDGRFQSPVRHTAGATDTNNLDNKQNHYGDSYADGNHIYFAHGEAQVQVWNRGPIVGASVSSRTLGSTYRTEVRIPRTLPPGAAFTWYPSTAPAVSGLTLTPGHIVGLNVVVSQYSGSSGDEYSGVWSSLFEPHSLVDFALLEQGDMNCDGVVNFDDIDPFVAALISPTAYLSQYPDCDPLLADLNGDEAVTFDDIDPFVIALIGG